LCFEDVKQTQKHDGLQMVFHSDAPLRSLLVILSYTKLVSKWHIFILSHRLERSAMEVS
jgi:hypothetical protein